MEKELSIPILHIADATADALLEAGIRTVGLLGTKYTMCQDFYRDKLIQAGFRVRIPHGKDIELVHHIIFDELCLGERKEASKAELLWIIDSLAREGAQGVILGCTEIGLLIHQADTSLPVFDTTLLHAVRAAELSLL